MNWKKLWKEFDAWCEDTKVMCSKCGKNEYFKSWTSQKQKIQELVKYHSIKQK